MVSRREFEMVAREKRTALSILWAHFMMIVMTLLNLVQPPSWQVLSFFRIFPYVNDAVLEEHLQETSDTLGRSCLQSKGKSSPGHIGIASCFSQADTRATYDHLFIAIHCLYQYLSQFA